MLFISDHLHPASISSCIMTTHATSLPSLQTSGEGETSKEKQNSQHNVHTEQDRSVLQESFAQPNHTA